MIKLNSRRFVVFSLGVFLPAFVYGQSPIGSERVSEGLTLTGGVFYPTHSIQGMVYDPQVGGYQISTSTQTNLPDPAPLLEQYNLAEDKVDYFLSLSPEEQASLWRSLEWGQQMPSYGDYKHVLLYNLLGGMDGAGSWYGAGAFRDFLANLPSGEAGPALGEVNSYLVDNQLGSVANMDLSDLDLTGLNTAGVDFGGTNLVGTLLSSAQLNAAYSYAWANMSGRNFEGFAPAGKSLIGCDLSGSNITIAQIISSGGIMGANLSGTGITREALAAAISAAGKSGTDWSLDSPLPVTF